MTSSEEKLRKKEEEEEVGQTVVEETSKKAEKEVKQKADEEELLKKEEDADHQCQDLVEEKQEQNRSEPGMLAEVSLSTSTDESRPEENKQKEDETEE